MSKKAPNDLVELAMEIQKVFAIILIKKKYLINVIEKEIFFFRQIVLLRQIHAVNFK